MNTHYIDPDDDNATMCGQYIRPNFPPGGFVRAVVPITERAECDRCRFGLSGIRNTPTTPVTFTIDRDHLDGTRSGQKFPLPYFPVIGDVIGTVEFNLFDDDNILYYSGSITAPERIIDECVERVFDWAMIDAGTTRITIDGVAVIG